MISLEGSAEPPSNPIISLRSAAGGAVDGDAALDDSSF